MAMPITQVTPEGLSRLLEESMTLLDVRTVEEYVGLGHIPQARLLPLHTLEASLNELNPLQSYAITCQHGVRSMDACFYLQSKGFTALYNLQEGMASWTGAMSYDPPTHGE
jgi:rhodanese-related sulfurtransferase